MDKMVFFLFLVFKLIIEVSIYSFIPIIIIFILNKFLNNKIPVKYQYILYIFIFIRLVSPVMPKSPLSLFNKMESVPILHNKDTIVNIIENKDKLKCYNNSLNYYREIDGGFKNEKYESFFDGIKKLDSYTKYLFLIWCIGVGILSVYNILAYMKLSKRIRFATIIKEEKVLKSMRESSKLFKIKSEFKLLELADISGPAVVGIKNPIILIPKGFLERVTEEELKNMLLHELCHYKRKDMIIIYLCKIVNILHWFNPLVWYANLKLKKALELSCDEKVLSYMNKEERINYGYTIINLVSNLKNNCKIHTELNMIGNKKHIENRIRLIRDFKDRSLVFRSISLILVILTGSVLLTENSSALAAMDKDIPCSYVVDMQGKIRKTDNIDMPFKNDNNVLGKWISVDFVRHIEEFNPSKRNWRKEDLYLEQLEFSLSGIVDVNYKNVKTLSEKWTKDFVLNPGQKIASKYYIKNIQGIEYMFFQWKSGDYTFRNAIPHYYVLKKVK